MKILVVDDEQGIVNSLRREIAEYDHDFTGVNSAEEGLELIRNNPVFDVIISDYMMPGMKGIEFLSTVKTEFPQALRILLTGKAPEDALAIALRTEVVNFHVAKPWSSMELFEIINSWKG